MIHPSPFDMLPPIHGFKIVMTLTFHILVARAVYPHP